MEVKLLHLYYDIMNLYGEYGNIKVLEKHLKDQGCDVTTDKKTIDDEINFDEYDFIYIGSGTEKNQKIILGDILKYKENFKNYIESGKIALFTGNSFEILGKCINGEPALNLLDFETENTDNRITADVICTSTIIPNKIVGFMNYMSIIKNNNNVLFNVEWAGGEGTMPQNKDGIIYKNLYGTHLIGPLLVRNPALMQFVIEKICTNKDENFVYKNLEYLDEQKGYELVLSELEARNILKNE